MHTVLLYWRHVLLCLPKACGLFNQIYVSNYVEKRVSEWLKRRYRCAPRGTGILTLFVDLVYDSGCC